MRKALLDNFLDKLDTLLRKARPWVPFTALNTVWRMLAKEAKTVLDVGCGKGEPMASINWGGRLEVVGIDIFKSYLDEAKGKGVYQELILGDVRHLPLKDKSFDVVICMEVLEHLEKVDGEKLLGELERVAKRQVLLSTPVGKYEQHPLDGNPHQKHRYIWQASDLRQRGYKIKGMGLKGLPREEVNSRFLKLIREGLYVLGGLFSYSFPEIACHIVAEKRLILD